MLGEDLIPRIPVGSAFESVVDWALENIAWVFHGIRAFLLALDKWLATGLNAIPAMVMAVVFALMALLVKDWRFGAITFVGMLLIAGMRYWERAMDTLSLVIVAGVIAMALALPLGILAARSSAASKIIKPVLDFMQTLPAFVYLIPAIFFFRVGVVPGLVSTIIFAMPPGVRLTELGIRQVDPEVVEAGHAFGTKPSTILTRIQIPLAMPTIMAGVNQVIMLSLSMVVIAGMVGAGGLGEEVYKGVTQLNLGKGFSSGLAVVILAIFLDRLTAALGDRSAVAKATRATAKAG